LLELLLERRVGGLGDGEIAGLESLSELRKELAERIRVGRVLGIVDVVMVVAVASGGGGARELLLKILLDGGVVLLGGGEIAGLEILG